MEEKSIFKRDIETDMLKWMERREALVNVKEAIESYLESLKKHDEPIPLPIEEELVEVNA